MARISSVLIGFLVEWGERVDLPIRPWHPCSPLQQDHEGHPNSQQTPRWVHFQARCLTKAAIRIANIQKRTKGNLVPYWLGTDSILLCALDRRACSVRLQMHLKHGMSVVGPLFEAWQIAESDLYVAICHKEGIAHGGECDCECPLPGDLENLRLLAAARLRLYEQAAHAEDSRRHMVVAGVPIFLPSHFD